LEVGIKTYYLLKLLLDYLLCFNNMTYMEGRKWRQILFLVLLSLLLYAVGVLVSAFYGHSYKFIISFLLYFATDLYIIINTKSYNKTLIVILSIIIAPVILIDLPIHFRNFSETLLSLPSSLAPILALLVALIVSHLRTSLKIVFTIISLLFAVWVGSQGYKIWIHYLNYGALSNNSNYKVPAPIEGYDQFNFHITTENFQGKIVLLDFWNTGCGICFQEFPTLQKFYDRYGWRQDIVIYAVNKPLLRDSLGAAFRILKKANYNFPILIPTDSFLPEKFGIIYYPTVLVIDHSGNIILKGDLESAIKLAESLVK
jgi:thiol-disulfide isomerase/thioredoxin